MGEPKARRPERLRNWSFALTAISGISLVLSGVFCIFLVKAILDLWSTPFGPGYGVSLSLFFLFNLLSIDVLVLTGAIFRKSKGGISIWSIFGPEIAGLIPILVYFGFPFLRVPFLTPAEYFGAHISIVLSLVSLFVLLKDRRMAKEDADSGERLSS